MTKENATGSSIIISRTPFRLSLGGGGTDLPSYYNEHGGFFVSGAINKYMYILLHTRFNKKGLRVSYSQTEQVDKFDEVKHPLVREALRNSEVSEGIEISSFADVPAASGLGSSGSFTVGLLRALYTMRHKFKTPEEIAEEACDIAMKRLNEPSGKQDEYVASLGGIRAYNIDTEGGVTSRELRLKEGTIAELESNILMFYTNITRESGTVLRKQSKQISSSASSLEMMHEIKKIGVESMEALESGNLKRFGTLLGKHWEIKSRFTDNMTSDQINSWYELALKNGALGGKLVGAGGGGFLMLYCDGDHSKLREALENEGLIEVRIRFDFDGSKVIYNV
jgi:D-glycero-alpha-D-manno-heptose-7-phosphate kinase